MRDISPINYRHPGLDPGSIFPLAELHSFSCLYPASAPRGTLYIGVTSALVQRIWQHKEKLTGGFTARYGVDKLIYFEEHATAEMAITREKQLKFWKRAWKIALIEEHNPDWIDLYASLLG